MRIEELRNRLRGSARLALQQEMGRANGNCYSFRVKALDLVQALGSHQPVFRGLQIKQRHFDLANFFSCITV